MICSIFVALNIPLGVAVAIWKKWSKKDPQDGNYGKKKKGKKQWLKEIFLKNKALVYLKPMGTGEG